MANEKKNQINASIRLSAYDMFCFMMQHTYLSFGGVLSLLFSVGSLFMLIRVGADVDTQYRIILAVCALLFTVINPLLVYIRSAKQVARKPELSVPIEYIFTEEGFTMKQNGEEASAEWNALWKVREGRTHFYLYGNRMRANIIPKKQMNGQEKVLSEFIKESLKRK